MNNKIGGYFEKDENSVFLEETKKRMDYDNKTEYVTSGRAAITLVLEDYKSPSIFREIKKKRNYYC